MSTNIPSCFKKPKLPQLPPFKLDNNGQEVSEEQNDNKINVKNNLPKHITDCGTNSNIEKNNDEVKKSGLDYIENKDIWKVDFFKGGFQLEFVSISRVINHMTCYRFECSHWWKIYF